MITFIQTRTIGQWGSFIKTMYVQNLKPKLNLGKEQFYIMQVAAESIHYLIFSFSFKGYLLSKGCVERSPTSWQTKIKQREVSKTSRWLSQKFQAEVCNRYTVTHLLNLLLFLKGYGPFQGKEFFQSKVQPWCIQLTRCPLQEQIPL